MSVESEGIDHYAVVLADLRAKRAQIDQAIQAIESLRGLGPSGSSATPSEEPQPRSENEAGAFLGMSIADATRKLLEFEEASHGYIRHSSGNYSRWISHGIRRSHKHCKRRSRASI